MQTTLELPEKHVQQLKALAMQQQVSETHLLQEIVADWLQQQSKIQHTTNRQTLRKKAFGLWKDNGAVTDGLSYQTQMRQEW